jgi:hypothetical protein
LSIFTIRLVAAQLAPAVAGRDRLVLERIGRGEAITQIGRDLGVTRERIRQIAERAAEAASLATGIEIPGMDQVVPMTFGHQRMEKSCADCGKPVPLGQRNAGRCVRCHSRMRHRTNRMRYRTNKVRISEQMRQRRKRIKMQAEKDIEEVGLGFEFGKKPFPEMRRGKGRWSEVLKRALALEIGDWFSVDLPTQALALSAAAATRASLGNRFPTSDPESRLFKIRTEKDTLFIKRLR